MATPPPGSPDPDERLDLGSAAEILGCGEPDLVELLGLGVLDVEVAGGKARLRRGDVEAYRDLRRRRRRALDEISQIVDRSPGGWDH